MHRDQGGSSSTELVLLMPVVLLLVLLIMQFGLWLHARQVAAAAAQEGLAAARTETGTGDVARARAQRLLSEAGGVRNADIEAQRTDMTARVAVSGTAPAVIPGVALHVSGLAEGPVERFIPETQR